MIITIRYLGQLATVTVPDGQLVYNGLTYIDPHKAQRLVLMQDVPGQVATIPPAADTLVNGGAAEAFRGNTFFNKIMCDIVSVVSSPDVETQAVSAPPIDGLWVLITPPGTVRTVIPTPTQE